MTDEARADEIESSSFELWMVETPIVPLTRRSGRNDVGIFSPTSQSAIFFIPRRL